MRKLLFALAAVICLSGAPDNRLKKEQGITDVNKSVDEFSAKLDHLSTATTNLKRAVEDEK